MKQCWYFQLTVTERTNIFCFIIVMLISVVCFMIAKKKKLPCWKFQIGWILFMDLLGVFLLLTRLIN